VFLTDAVHVLQANDAGGRADSKPVPQLLRAEAVSSESRGGNDHSESLPCIQGTREIQAKSQCRGHHSTEIPVCTSQLISWYIVVK